MSDPRVPVTRKTPAAVHPNHQSHGWGNFNRVGPEFADNIQFHTTPGKFSVNDHAQHSRIPAYAKIMFTRSTRSV